MNLGKIFSTNRSRIDAFMKEHKLPADTREQWMTKEGWAENDRVPIPEAKGVRLKSYTAKTPIVAYHIQYTEEAVVKKTRKSK